MSNDFNMGAPSGFTPPVTEFKGTLGEIYKDEVTKRFGKVEEASFVFGDVEIIEATSPSIEDSYTVEIIYKEFANTQWDEFRKSLVAFMPDEFNGDIMAFIGYTFHMKWDDVMLTKRNEVTEKFEVVPGKGWRVIDVDGLDNRTAEADTTLQDTIISEIINGNNEADAVLAFHQHEGIRSMSGYAEAMAALTAGTLIADYALANLITEDDAGVWNMV